MSRRRFLKTGGFAAMAVPLLFILRSLSSMPNSKYVSLRPVADKRHFVSKTVEVTIVENR